MKVQIYFLLLMLATFSCSKPQDNYLMKVYELPDEMGASGYVNAKGDTIIPVGKYLRCYTDTLKTYAVVLTQGKRLIGIDENEKELFEVFWFDNGPDYVSDGLFRIVKNDKIGYADESGKIVIEPQYDCAYPFENGTAKASKDCTTSYTEEHAVWYSNHWEIIQKPE